MTDTLNKPSGELCAARAVQAALWQALEAIPDPQIPVISIVDLGIVRFVECAVGERPRVGITPTYSGCPATEVIRRAVRAALDNAGHPEALIEEVLAPAWSSEWLSIRGREKLRQFGIAPPGAPSQPLAAGNIACPRCGSLATAKVSEFGSSPCQAHYRCGTCLEPFDYFKCL